MSFCLKPDRPIGRELKRLARKELGGTAERLLEDKRDDEAVHESRKSVKKVEALAALLDQMGEAPPRRDIKRLRASRKALSPLRDAEAIVQTFDRLRSRFSGRLPEHTSGIIRKQLLRRKTTIARRAQASSGSLARTVKVIKKIRRSAKRWGGGSAELSDMPGVLKQSFRAARKAMKEAQVDGTSPGFHDWRKCVKTLLYQLRLLERLVAGMSRRIDGFRELETALGEEHNLAVLRGTLQRDRRLRPIHSHVESLTAMSMAFQEELRRTALVLGARLLEPSPKAFAKDLRRRIRPHGTRRRKSPFQPRQQTVA
jgi:CHAD domain-containing protein